MRGISFFSLFLMIAGQVEITFGIPEGSKTVSKRATHVNSILSFMEKKKEEQRKDYEQAKKLADFFSGL
ncbi:unnamed protein product [Oikopleura dioica]|uniref:Uncharacterized protein n=1 Tax=Oikopleura dioica TaxID=34765 RepID=E4X1L6_OIKDI|nr:unnamed protein product [Oikopleura dioica]